MHGPILVTACRVQCLDRAQAFRSLHMSHIEGPEGASSSSFVTSKP